MLKFFKKKKKEPILIIDNRKDKKTITPVKGNIDPIHAILIAAAMQSGDVVFGNFDGDKLEIED